MLSSYSALGFPYPQAYLGPGPTGGPKPLPGKSASTPSTSLLDRRVVIVEDEGLTQIQLRRICEAAGMSVVGVAADGAQGVERALEMQPDIVLMDIKMPVVDGFVATELILKQLKVCVIMLTAYDLEDHKARAKELGAAGYIVKPVTSGTLIPQLEAIYTAYRGPRD